MLRGNNPLSTLSTKVKPEEMSAEEYETLVVQVTTQLWGLIISYLVFSGFPKLGWNFRLQYSNIVPIIAILLALLRHNLFPVCFAI